VQPPAPIALGQPEGNASELVPDRRKKRFDYEKVNLASRNSILA
jgi:hypothetical protein